jgi:hypothetical protein
MRIISMLFGLLFISIQAMALGKIAGKVTDEKTGEPVIGATVVVKGTPNGASTDIDGNYTINIEAGTYTVEVKYIGYQPKEVEDVKVAATGVTEVNVAITEASSTQLGEVVVRSTLKRENVNALYVLQKNNVSVSSGISADIIQRSPDRNTGEVLKRVSGTSIQNGKFVIIRGLNDRYNTAMVNGAQMPSTEPDRKAFSFDIIPSNLIDNLIINKTASPDMPGDFAGGIVQVLTKDVPEENFVNAGITLGYNTQSTFQDFKSTPRTTSEHLGFANGTTGLPSSFGDDFEHYNALPENEKISAAKELPNNYGMNTASALPNSSLQLSYGAQHGFKNGDKFGAIIGISHRTSSTFIPEFRRATWLADATPNSDYTDTVSRYSSSLAGLANFSYVAGKSKITFRNLYTGLHDQNTYTRGGFSESSSQLFIGYSAVPSDRKLYNTQLEGEHAFGEKNLKVNWNLNYSYLNGQQTDLRSVFYNRGFDRSAEGDRVPTGVGYSLNDRNSRRFFSDLTDNNYGGNVSVSLPFEMFKQTQTVKVGYLGLYKSRTFGARIFQYEYFPSTLANPDVVMLPYDQVLAPENLAYSTGIELSEITNNTDAYEASSFLNAGYVMLDNHFSEEWRLSWGARVESYMQNLQATDFSGKNVDTTSNVLDVLPSINLSYSPGEKTKVRLSGSRTVNRPEFREIAPFQFTDIENLFVLVGNPQLGRCNITNADLRYEYYPQPGEVITIGAFYKHFLNPIENTMNAQSNYDLLIFGYQNASSAQAFGGEVDIRKNLSFISDAKWLENIILGGNFTYVYSSVDVSNLNIAGMGGVANRPLQGQSPYLINLSVLYNDPKTGLGVSALYNRAGDRIFIVGNSTIPTTWEKGRNVIDLQLSKSLLKNKAELKLTVSDILNQSYTFYWEYDGSTGYNEASDRPFQTYKLGTVFNLGFTYKFGMK